MKKAKKPETAVAGELLLAKQPNEVAPEDYRDLIAQSREIANGLSRGITTMGGDVVVASSNVFAALLLERALKAKALAKP